MQETFLNESSTVNFPGYVLLNRDGKNGRGGEAFLIRKEISYSGFEKLKSTEGISVKILIDIYWSSTQEFQGSALSEVFQRDNVLIGGDFNAKSTLQGSTCSDGRGK